MKPPQTDFHPTRRFTLVARNVEFAQIAAIGEPAIEPRGSIFSDSRPGV